MNKIQRFIQLPSRERRTLIKAWWLLLGFWIALRTRPYKKVAPLAEVPLGNDEEQDPETLDWCVRAAAGTHIVQPRCLERSLTLQRLLRNQGLLASLQIGVRSEGDSIAAHAWLEVNGEPIGEPEDVDQRFAPLE